MQQMLLVDSKNVNKDLFPQLMFGSRLLANLGGLIQTEVAAFASEHAHFAF